MASDHVYKNQKTFDITLIITNDQHSLVIYSFSA